MNWLVYGSCGSGSPRIRSMPNIQDFRKAVDPGTPTGWQRSRAGSAPGQLAIMCGRSVHLTGLPVGEIVMPVNCAPA